MTDELPLRASMCPEEGCYALIPSDYRLKHAAGHTSAKKSARGFRGRLTKIDLDLAEVKDDHRIVLRKLEKLDEVPVPDPLAIEPWPEDELPDDDEDLDDEDPGLEGQELDDDDDLAIDAVARFTAVDVTTDGTVEYAPAIDRDDDYPPTVPVA